MVAVLVDAGKRVTYFLFAICYLLFAIFDWM
jgi:hypothetical protein